MEGAGACKPLLTHGFRHAKLHLLLLLGDSRHLTCQASQKWSQGIQKAGNSSRSCGRCSTGAGQRCRQVRHTSPLPAGQHTCCSVRCYRAALPLPIAPTAQGICSRRLMACAQVHRGCAGVQGRPQVAQRLAGAAIGLLAACDNALLLLTTVAADWRRPPVCGVLLVACRCWQSCESSRQGVFVAWHGSICCAGLAAAGGWRWLIQDA
jgi:hypothetical protein